MKKRSMSVAVLVGALVVLPAVSASADDSRAGIRYCSIPRTVSITADQTGWGSHTYHVTGEVRNIVQPLLVRSTRTTYSAAVSTGWKVHSALTVHSATASCWV